MVSPPGKVNRESYSCFCYGVSELEFCWVMPADILAFSVGCVGSTFITMMINKQCHQVSSMQWLWVSGQQAALHDYLFTVWLQQPISLSKKTMLPSEKYVRSETDLPKQVFRVKNINTTCSRGAVDFTPANVRHPALLSPTVGPQPRSGFPNQTQLETENALTAACLMLSLAHQPLLSLRLYISVYVYIGVKSETQ